MKKTLFVFVVVFLVSFTVVGCASGNSVQLSNTTASYKDQEQNDNNILYHSIGKSLAVGESN